MRRQIYLGLDVGGTKIEGAVGILNSTAHSIEVLSQKRIPCIPDIHQFIDSFSILIKDLLNDSKLSFSDLIAIGIGLPGTLDPKTKVMLNGNTRFLIGHDVIAILRKKLGIDIPILAENDANLFAYAEAWGGAGLIYKKEKNIPFKEQIALGITLGTGVGGGLSALGKIYSGANGSGLEVGHIVLKRQGHACYCGQFGCSEASLSGTALNKLGDSKLIFEKAAAGDADSKSILGNYRENMVHFLSILNNLFNPHYFVFGGGLSAQNVLFENLKEDLEDHIFLSREYCPEIYINKLGDGAGLFGAMVYASEIL